MSGYCVCSVCECVCVCVYVCVVSECHSGTSTIKTPRPRGGCLTIKETCNAICHLQCLVALNQHFQQYVRSAQCAAPTQALPCTPQMSLYHGICCTGTFCVILILFQLSLLLLAPLWCLHSTCYIFLLLSSPCFRIFSSSPLITFLVPDIATSINLHVAFLLSRIAMSVLLSLSLLLLLLLLLN